MAALVVQKISRVGALRAALIPAVVTGDTFVNEGKTFLHVNNADASGITVTIVGQRNLPLGVSATKTVAVAAGADKLIGPFPVGNYNRETDESVEVTYSAVANITVGALSVNEDYN